MHYKRTKVVETVVYDGEIKDPADVKAIIESLCNHEYDVSMRVAGEVVIHPRVRIISVGEETFKFSIIGIGSSLTKTARYQDIESLSVSSNDMYSAQMKPGITRWSLLNSTSEFDAGETPKGE